MKPNLIELAQQLAPLIAEHLMRTPTIYGGNSDRVICGAGVKLVNTFFNVNSGCVIIGDDSFFGHNVSVITGSHDIDKFGAERKKFPHEGNDIKIGRGVWVASGAIILGPCEIGDNAVIAAGSIVLPGLYDANCLYAGVPARLKKKL